MTTQSSGHSLKRLMSAKAHRVIQRSLSEQSRHGPAGKAVENDPSATLTESKSRSAANPDLILANPLCCPSG